MPDVRSFLAGAARRFLARRGFALLRVRHGVPPALGDYLAGAAGSPIEKVFCFDGDPATQSELLRVFGAERVVFCATLAEPDFARAIPKAPPPGRFLVVVDAGLFSPADLRQARPWLLEAGITVVRGSCGYFWSGQGDLAAVTREMGALRLRDVIDPPGLAYPTGALSPVYLIFDKIGPADAAARGRAAEALAFLGAPMAKSSALTRLAGGASFGMAAGVLNPGAIADGPRLLLLARGERVPWTVLRGDLRRFLSGCQPLLLELNAALAVTQVREMTWTNAGDASGARMEDFRLFRRGGELFANHSRYRDGAGQSGPVNFDALLLEVCVSRVNVEKAELTFLGVPKIDRLVARHEKNWAFFECGGRLHAIYSFQPYRLLRDKGSPLEFETVHERELALPWLSDVAAVRNSVNPVDYDEEHLLHVFHQALHMKQYVFWAALISKKTLLPVKVGRRPLAQGWQSAPASILYLCSAVAQKEDVLFFTGLNDSAMGCWRVPRAELDANWVPLGAATV